MSINKNIAIIFFCFFGTSAIYSQDVYTNFHFSLGFPQEQLKGNVDNIGYGFNGQLLACLGDGPLLAGLDVGALFFEKIERRINIPDINIKLEPIKGVLLAHLLLRAQRMDGNVRPFVEGLIGVHHFFSDSETYYG